MDQFSFKQFLVPAYTSSQGLQATSNVVSANYKDLICCTCHFQSSSLFFVYFGFLCLQVASLSSALTQGGKGGHLFSCAVGKEENHKQISLACVESACDVWATLGLPPWRVLSWSTLLRLQVDLQGNCLRWALGCMHFPHLSCSG